jgi:hypothetical protein
MYLRHSILGNSDKWFDCTSDRQHKIKFSRNFVVVQCQGPAKHGVRSLFVSTVVGQLTHNPKAGSSNPVALTM